MRKFTFFLFLFFSVFCFAQNRDAKTTSRGQNPFQVKQASSVKQNNNAVQQKPVAYTTSNNTSVQRTEPYKTVSPRPVVNPTAQKPSLQKIDSTNKISLSKEQINKEQKPSNDNTNRPQPRPGNYRIIYWNNFIEPTFHNQREWASKVLDTQNLSLDGSGVQVAVLDSGIKPHKQFDGANIEVLDITGQNDPFDFCGHGTAVVGIIAGQKGNDFKGIAPRVNLKSYKIADESGTTNNTYIINALDSILEYNRQNPNAKINIVNISYGLEEDNFELRNKLAEVYSSGITIISASGNDGKQGLLFPAKYNFVFAAGSINQNKQISDFSNWGEGLDFVLPGSGLKTLGLDNDYVWVRGTSFSSAYLTGIAALSTQAFKNKHGRLPSPQELYEVLQKISMPIVASSLKQGYGVPDASKIVSYI